MAAAASEKSIPRLNAEFFRRAKPNYQNPTTPPGRPWRQVRCVQGGEKRTMRVTELQRKFRINYSGKRKRFWQFSCQVLHCFRGGRHASE